ncbi:GIY-YIG nuclease family protein [Priestia megaterium]|uniref:GIY-YIG nuclease family protein n=1 Tax=Priestia megaterium TaxID=1404 RepID=UPI002878028F|nr:GIY-YIG nuclease family protein [Priestia megaterium]
MVTVKREYNCDKITDLYATESQRLNECFQSPGIYILKDKGGKILYIGMTDKSLSTRVQQHINGVDPATFDCRRYIYKIDLYVFDGNKENLNRIGALEHDLIASYDPPCNNKHTTRQFNKHLVKAEVEKYLESVDFKYNRNNWTPYEKFAFVKGISIADAAMIAAAQFEFGTDMSLIDSMLNTNDWVRNLRSQFISKLGSNGMNENEIIKAAWEVVLSYDLSETEHGKAMQKLLSNNNEYKNKLTMITKSEIVNKTSYNLDKPSREYDIELTRDFSAGDEEDHRKEFEKKHQKLLSTGDYYIFDISSINQKIADVGHFTLSYLQSYATDRYTQPYTDKYGELIYACLSEDEIFEISKIMITDDGGSISTDFDYNF